MTMEWEQCKENIKPKREGRDVSMITATPKSTAQLAKIQDRQADFEREISNYAGDDELEVWIRYVKFMEESFPEGDFRSKILTLQHRMVEKFKEVEKYKQDKRMLSVILDLATFSKEPTCVFAYCYYHKLCTHYAAFWHNWILTWIFIHRYDKALKICRKSLEKFVNPPPEFKRLQVEILRLIDREQQSSDRADVNERAVGSVVKESASQKKLPGPKSVTVQTNKMFSISRDTNKDHLNTIPVCSTNVSENKFRIQENYTGTRQRWKDTKLQCQGPIPNSEMAFSIFEDTNKVPNQNLKISVSTSALKVKKCKSYVAPNTSSATLNPITNLVETYGYSKSRVYPNDNEEWSFEELEAQRRQKLKLNAESHVASEESKRSIEDVVPKADESHQDSKKQCSISLNSSKPLKSSLRQSFNSHTLPTPFNFELTGIYSSTKRISNDDGMPSESDFIMKPNFDNSENNRPSLNIPARHDRSSIINEDILEGVDLTSKGFTAGIGIDDLEDVKVKENSLATLHSQPKVRGLFSKKKNKTSEFFDEPSVLVTNPAFDIFAESDDISNDITAAPVAFDIFSDPQDANERPEGIVSASVKKAPISIFSDSPDGNDNPGESLANADFDLKQLKNMGRDSEVFDIFPNSAKRGRTNEESYSLQTVSMTSSTQATNASQLYVPCTVDKMANRPDTQKINKHVLKIVNDCSKISESDESFKAKSDVFESSDDIQKNRRVTFADGDHIETIRSEANSKLSDDSESTIPTTKVDQDFDFEDCSQSKFEVFTDTFASHNQNDKLDSDVYESSRLEKKQLTPILEGSRESDSSSLSNKVSSESYKSTDFPLTTILEASINKNLSDDMVNGTFDEPEETRIIYPPPQEAPEHFLAENKDETATVVTKDLDKERSTVNTEKLKPDRTARDFHFDVENFTCVPETRATTTPVTDPFNDKLITSLIRSLDPPLLYREGFVQLKEQDVHIGKVVQLGKIKLEHVTKIGEGAFASVYKAIAPGHNSEIAIKVQSPPAPWEFYILSELLRRLSENTNPILDMVLPLHSFYIYRNNSVLVTKYFDEGSFLDMINRYRLSKKQVSKTIICTYAIDMLRCIEAIHRTHIIHGDIKPDNWLLQDKETTINSMTSISTKSLVLIDFGRSIDMELLPPSSEFTVSCKTDLFECVEMKNHRPWTYQTDYFGVLACIHLLMHKDYLKVYQDKSTGLWRPIKTPPRFMDKTVFNKLFSDLLNVQSCTQLPSLDVYIDLLEKYQKTIDVDDQLDDVTQHYDFLDSR